jgi:hypothetical protein
VILLEFAAQGVRGVAPAGGRATLRPGYNVVAADGPALRRLLEALLYPDPRDADALPRAPGGPAGAAPRAGLTLVGNDRATYRLVRDFAAGCQLHRFDAEKRSFALVSQDLAQIRPFLEKTVGVPPPGRLAALLSLSAAELPSRQGGPALGGAGPAGPPGRPSLSPEQARKRLDALRVELEKARIAEKLQYQLDGLQARLFKLEESLKGGAKLREGLEKALEGRGELDRAAEVAAALGDADAKLAAFDRATARRDEALAKVAAEREVMDRAETAGLPRPFWADPLFWPGAGGGLALAIAGWAGAAARSDLRHVALVAIPAFGWAAWRALRWVGALEAGERVVRRRRIVEDWEKKVLAQYDRDAADVRAALQALGVAKPAELREALARVADADQVVAEWRRRVAEWEGSDEAKGGLAEKARVEEELRAVEGRLSEEAGGFVRDVRSVEAEIQRLEAEAASAPAAPVAAPRAPAPRPAGEPIRTLLERAAAELGGSPTAAARAVAQKASAALVGLSFQRLQALQVDDRGNVQVQTGGRPAPALSLAPADRDVVYLSLKLAFLEQALAAGRAVAVADDVFAGLSEGSRRFAARLLKQMARPGQLLHATSDAAFREAADHAA